MTKNENKTNVINFEATKFFTLIMNSYKKIVIWESETHPKDYLFAVEYLKNTNVMLPIKIR